MKPSSAKYQPLTGYAIVILGLLTVFAIGRSIEPLKPVAPPDWEDEDLALQARRLKGFAFGAEGLIADWYWMRSLQYIGAKLIASGDEFVNIDDLRSLEPRLLHPYLDSATDLDPGFIAAYSYGALVLPAIDPEKAIALTQKGVANNPDSWRLLQYLGYIHWRLGRFDEAAGAYARGAQIQGAPSFMKLMSAAMKNQGGSRDTARSIYRQMADEGGDSETRYYGRFRLSQLDSLDERDAMNASLRAFRERSGRCVNGWTELLPLIRGVKLPEGRTFRIDHEDRVVDPSNAPYLLDLGQCEVALDPAATKVPLD